MSDRSWRLKIGPMKRFAALMLPLMFTACAQQPTLQADALAQVDQAMESTIAQRQMPGGALWIEQAGRGSYHRAYGWRATDPAPETLDEDTVFDAASLTKPVVTATLVQVLREQGKLDVDAPLQRYLPDCGGPEKARLTLRQLLTHSSGLPAGLPRNGAGDWSGIADARRIACALPLTELPGTQFRYSDVNYILLGLVIAQQSGLPLEVFAERALFKPLGMVDSGYLPLRRIAAARIAPTERMNDGHVLRGEVHDPSARRMGGVAGHAGLFTTTSDLARFARMLLAGGMAENGRRLLSPESVALLTTVQSSPAITAQRSMGWDIDSPYSRPRGQRFPKTSFGHTGFTGCAFWLDPGSRSFYILLANRVHPGHPTNTLPLYERLGTLAAQAAGVGG